MPLGTMGVLVEEGTPLAKIIEKAQDLANQIKQRIDAKAASHDLNLEVVTLLSRDLIDQ